MKILDGKLVSSTVRQRLKGECEALTKNIRRPPGLAVVLVGEDPASQVYVRNKIRSCAEVGISSFEHKVSQSCEMGDLQKIIHELNQDPKVDGILVQLPLPKQIDEKKVLAWIDPRKDADCLTTENLGLLWSGRPRVLPCTPGGVMEILKHYDIQVEGLRALVIGRSEIVGKPMSLLLTGANATVTLSHSKTKDLKSETLRADLVVAAAGRPEFLDHSDFKKDAILIDVGIHRKEVDGKTKLVGDINPEGLEGHIFARTPVPGGVGPMTITTLLENTLKLCSERANSSAL